MMKRVWHILINIFILIVVAVAINYCIYGILIPKIKSETKETITVTDIVYVPEVITTTDIIYIPEIQYIEKEVPIIQEKIITDIQYVTSTEYMPIVTYVTATEYIPVITYVTSTEYIEHTVYVCGRCGNEYNKCICEPEIKYETKTITEIIEKNNLPTVYYAEDLINMMNSEELININLNKEIYIAARMSQSGWLGYWGYPVSKYTGTGYICQKTWNVIYERYDKNYKWIGDIFRISAYNNAPLYNNEYSEYIDYTGMVYLKAKILSYTPTEPVTYYGNEQQYYLNIECSDIIPAQLFAEYLTGTN